jgi:hypothetical protein
MYFNKKQLCYFLTIFTILLVIVILPSVISVQSPSQKQDTMQQNNNNSRTTTAPAIFNNNLIVALVSLIPYVGWGWLGYVIWNTGVVLASYSQPWYWVLGNPFVYVEFAVYSYMVLRSIKLVRLFRQRKTRFTDLDGKVVVRKTTGVYPEIVKTAAYTFIVATVVLLAAALVEYVLIQSVILID